MAFRFGGKLPVGIHRGEIFGEITGEKLPGRVNRGELPPPPKTVLYLIVVGSEQPSRGMLVRLCHQGRRPLAEEPPRALRQVERLTRIPEKLANAKRQVLEGHLRA